MLLAGCQSLYIKFDLACPPFLYNNYEAISKNRLREYRESGGRHCIPVIRLHQLKGRTSVRPREGAKKTQGDSAGRCNNEASVL